MKPLPCPFCGATPKRGLDKIRYCQLHGDPYQEYLIWCPKGHAKITGVDEAQALQQWNTRAAAATREGRGVGGRRARVAELEADAARYRWLRGKVCIIGTPHLSYQKAIFEFVNLPYPPRVAHDPSAELDAAIDAARLSGNKPPQCFSTEGDDRR